MGTITRKRRLKQPQLRSAKFDDSSPIFGNRIAELEQSVSELTKRVEELEQRGRFELPKPPKLKRGPKPKLRQTQLLNRRDSLIYWLEDNWPELSRAIRSAKTREQLIPTLRRMRPLSSHYEQPPFIKEWKQYWPKLWEFVTESGRYYNNPRNIAHALAGIPELSWKRSFDVCSSHPSHLEIQKRAVLDYLRRNVPKRLKEIRAAGDNVVKIREILERRSKDRQLHILALQAEQIPQYLKDAAANFIFDTKGRGGL